ncbi:MAG: TIGR02206 family membrane protein, partial [Candidatus Marinimicrobia bacterium]|nr:TIGR02206 family membrane protein [Candidatus Neomarinimicrobiota bacterium]
QGMVTPDIVQDFPHFHYFRFFIGHNLMVVALVYAVVVYDMKPTLSSLKKAFIGLNIFLAVAFFTNIILDANYFWIMGKPPMESLLDYMGPWPWYILTGEFVALGHFGFAYFLYQMIRKYSNNT